LSQRGKERRRAKLSATVDSALLAEVDRFVAGHADANRGMVIDEALRLWTLRERERALKAQFDAPQPAAEREDHATWLRRRREAASTRLFRPR
jgi:hypothetical protein